MSAVGVMVACALLSVAVAWWRGRRAAAHRADLQQGGRATIRARLAVPGDRWRAGRIALSRAHCVWASRRTAPPVDLAGGQVVSSAVAAGFHARPDDVVVRLQLADGSPVDLMLDVHDAALLADVLAGLPAATPDAAPVAPPPGRRWWAYLLLAASGLWMAYCACMFVTGYDATVRVVGGDGAGFCDVVWEDASGARQSGEADCNDEPAGSLLEVRVTGWPGPGDPTSAGTYVAIAMVFGVPPAAVGALRLGYLRRRRRAWDAASSAAVIRPRPSTSLTPLTEQDLHLKPGEQPQVLLARLAPFARRQIPPDGWEDARRPEGVRGPVRAGQLAKRLLWPVWLLVTVALVTWPQPYHWYVLGTGATATTQATSTGERVNDGWGPVPDLVAVEYRDATGSAARADVAVDVALPEGAEVVIEYSTTDASAARVLGDGDALALGGVTGSVGLLVGLLWLVGTGISAWRRSAAVQAARSVDRRPALGLLTSDHVGGPVVLAVDPLVAPLCFVAVPLQHPLPAGTAARFAEFATPPLTSRGALRTGEVVALEVDGVAAPLVPAGPAVELPLDVVLDLIDSAGSLVRATARNDGSEQLGHDTAEPLGSA